MPEQTQRVLRTTARVIPVCETGEVLLLQELDPAVSKSSRWGTIGGAVDEGETLVQTAVRELHEETGIVISPEDLTPPLHRVRQPFSWNGTPYLGDSTFFAMRLDRNVEISFDELEPEEVGTVLAAAWWRPGDLTPDLGLVWSDLAAIAAIAVRAVLGGRR